jgi:hypothetical protein
MINIFQRYHIINNFPKKYPFHKKILSNIIFFFTGIIIHPRKNELTHKDLIKARLSLKRGDIILTGNLRTLLHSLIQEPVTHSSLYVGNLRFIHSMAEGVQYISLYKLFTDYDTLVILRLPKTVKKKKKIIRKTLKFAKTQFGKPYDFDFKQSPHSFFCTQLVNEAFKHAGYNTGLLSIKMSKKIPKKLKKHINGVVDALSPVDFLNGKFEVVYLSHNLEYKNKKLNYLK